MFTKPNTLSTTPSSRPNGLPRGAFILTAGISGVILGVLAFVWLHRNDDILEISLQDDGTISINAKHLPMIEPEVAVSPTTPAVPPRLAVIRPVELLRLSRVAVWKAAATAVLLAAVDDLQRISNGLRIWLQGQAAEHSRQW